MTAPAQATATDRALAAFRSLVLSVYPAAIYWIVHEYAVAESDGLTFSGTPTDATFSPSLPTHVPYAPALAGASCVVPVGALAYVGFANGDPAKPFLVRFGAGVTSASTAINAAAPVVLGATAGAVTGSPTVPQRFAREGDVYSLGAASGPLTFVSTTQISGPTTGKG